MRAHLRSQLLVGALALPMLLSSSGCIVAPRPAYRPVPVVEARPEVTLTVSQQRYIERYYESHRRSRRHKDLPPGMRKRLARGEPLPPGIAKQVAPVELSSRIELPRGYRLVEVGRDVVLVEVRTGVVRDVLRDVMR